MLSVQIQVIEYLETNLMCSVRFDSVEWTYAVQLIAKLLGDTMIPCEYPIFFIKF